MDIKSDIKSFKVHIDNEELSDILIKHTGGFIKTCRCKNGSLLIRGVKSDGGNFWFELVVRSQYKKIILEVADAYVAGVPWGIQELVVSTRLEEILKRYLPNVKSGGRTISIVPFDDIVDFLVSICKIQEISLSAPDIALTENGLEISFNEQKTLSASFTVAGFRSLFSGDSQRSDVEELMKFSPRPRRPPSAAQTDPKLASVLSVQPISKEADMVIANETDKKTGYLMLRSLLATLELLRKESD